MVTKDELAIDIVNQMMKDDLFSQWLGIQIIEIKEGYSKIKMKVRKEMMNGLHIVHGGIAFSLADSSFAFACNSRNNLSVALDMWMMNLLRKQRKCIMVNQQGFTK